MRRLFARAALFAAVASCAHDAPIGPTPRAPLAFERIALPAPATSANASSRGALITLSDGRVAIVAPDGATRVASRADAIATCPTCAGDATAAAAGFTWLASGDAIVRTSGARSELLARGLALGPTARVAVEETGAAAIVIDARGVAWRIAADEALRVAGFADGARVTDTRLTLEALAVEGTAFAAVDYFLDDRPIAQRRAPPWGWGPDGASLRDAGEMSFGTHVVRVDARTRRGRAFSRTLHVDYVSPLASAPSYARDVVPLFRAHCASCHDRGLARDLASYDRLRAMIPRLRASIREARMPPDLALAPDGVTLFTAWCDSDGPP